MRKKDIQTILNNLNSILIDNQRILTNNYRMYNLYDGSEQIIDVSNDPQRLHDLQSKDALRQHTLSIILRCYIIIRELNRDELVDLIEFICRLRQAGGNHLPVLHNESPEYCLTWLSWYIDEWRRQQSAQNSEEKKSQFRF